MQKVFLLVILSAVGLVLGCGVLPSRTPAAAQNNLNSNNESSNKTNGTVWLFRLLQGDSIEISGDLKSLAIQTSQLIILGTGVAQSASYGPHKELLNLITPRENFRKGVDLVWFSPHLTEEESPKKYISLKEVLSLNEIEWSELIYPDFVGRLRDGLDMQSDYAQDIKRFMALAQFLLEKPLSYGPLGQDNSKIPEIWKKVINLRLNTFRKIPQCKDLLAAP